MIWSDSVFVLLHEVAQSCPTLFDPMGCSLPGSSIHGIFLVRILEWVAISFSICFIREALFTKGIFISPLKILLCKEKCYFVYAFFYSHQAISCTPSLHLLIVVIQWLSHGQLFVTPWTVAHQTSMSYYPEVCSNSFPLNWWCHPTISSSVTPFSSCPQSFSASESFLVSHSSHQVFKVLELQHQSFQWVSRIDFLSDWMVWSLCSPVDSQDSSLAPQFASYLSLYICKVNTAVFCHVTMLPILLLVFFHNAIGRREVFKTNI